MKARGFYLWISPFLIVALAWICVVQRAKLRELEGQLAANVIAARSDQSKLSQQATEIAALKRQVDEAVKPALSGDSDPHLEDMLGDWIENVHHLRSYLEKHPELSIPQMAKLNDGDWLLVTQNGIKSDWSYRYAIARLRLKARERVAGVVGNAMRQYIQTSGHNPTDPHDLQPYLSAGYDPSILDELQVNPAKAGNFVGSSDHYPLVDKRVDLWDGTLWYSTEGSSAEHSIEASRQDDFLQAIDAFKKANGSPPVLVADLATYPGINKIDPATLNTMFDAFTTEPTQ